MSKYVECLDCQLSVLDLLNILNRLSLPWATDKVNDKILHIIIWRGGEKFRLRFVNDDEAVYKFTGILEG